MTSYRLNCNRRGTEDIMDQFVYWNSLEEQDESVEPEGEGGFMGWLNKTDDLSGSPGFYDTDGDGDVDYSDASTIYADASDYWYAQGNNALGSQYENMSVSSGMAGSLINWFQGD